MIQHNRLGRELGVCLPVNSAVGQSDQGVLFLHGVVVSSAGFGLLVSAFWRNPELFTQPVGSIRIDGRYKDAPRLGVQLPDGHTYIDRVWPRGLPNGLRQDFDFWVPQIPNGDAVEVVCEWPAVSLSRSTLLVDGAAIQRAAADSRSGRPEASP